MNRLKYVMIIEPAEDKDGPYYCAYFPDLPGCTTMGNTLHELSENAHEAVSLYVQALRDTGQAVPEPAVLVDEVSIKAS